ncbi:unnamed protein product [Urochloa decumbens]|uniref:Uncharacterized protein n=1 Tax=Urochloa decumbens TaxID=240449 RepID=A0ABC9FY67_9POAL
MAAGMYLKHEMEALMDGPGLPCSKPHQLVPQGDDMLVVIASTEGLDAALSTASFKGRLRGYVVPAASYKDCALLKAAAESGFYGASATPFILVNYPLVGSKVSAIDGVKKELADIAARLNWMESYTLGRVRTQVIGRVLSQQQRIRAAESTAQWAAIVEGTRRKSQRSISSTVAQLKSIVDFLESA